MNFKTLCLTLLVAFYLGCDEKKDKESPLVSTDPLSEIASTSAKGGGTVTSDGGTTVLLRGVCWGLASPTVDSSKTSDGLGEGSFVSAITNLLPKTTYFVRAYAVNAVGISYGDEVEFTTTDLPTVVTAVITEIDSGSAVSGGTVQSDNGSTVTARGICWNTSPFPTIANSKVENGSDTGSFVSNLSGLSSNTTYYVRAFATNSVGTAYGNEFQFTTLGLPVVMTSAITNIDTTSAVSGGHVSSDGGITVSQRGVCWSTSSPPTVADSKTVNGSDTGAFVGNLVGLSVNTTYYARAYATNSVGTAYGNERQFRTLGEVDTLFQDPRDGKSYKIVVIGGSIWMAENLNFYTPSGSWYYNNDSLAYAGQYGRLYDWTTAVSAVPSGWHLPTKTEWDSLIAHVGGSGNPSYLQLIPSGQSGFRSLMAGFRFGDADFRDFGIGTLYWTSTEEGSDAAWYGYVYSNSATAGLNFYTKTIGVSVRCVKD